MRTYTDDSAIVQTKDPVCGADGGDALRNQEYCRIFRMPAQCGPQSGIRCVIERRGAVVEDQDIRRPARARAMVRRCR